jgi:hypothetical protein
MAEQHVSVTLDFITDDAPATVGARVVQVVVAEVAVKLASASWHGFELDDEPADGADGRI